jgi:HEAT repeat protein
VNRIAAIVLLLLSQEAVPVERTFVEAAGLHGDEYAVAREFLVSQGRALLPFLSEREKSEDWRERRLARFLTLRIQRPDAPEDHPDLALDRLWERLSGSKFHGRSWFAKDIAAVGRPGNGAAARPLLELAANAPKISRVMIFESLVRIGPAALPALREEVGSDRHRLPRESAAALARLKDPQGLTVILREMARRVRAGRGKSKVPMHSYSDLRKAARTLVELSGAEGQIAAFAEAGGVVERALAAGIRFGEFDGGPERLVERAAAYGKFEDVKAVARLPEDDPGFEVLADLSLTHHDYRGSNAKLMDLLAARYGERALVPLGAELEGNFTSRIHNLIRNVLFIGSKRGVPILDEIVRRNEGYAAPAMLVRKALTGPPEILESLLRHRDTRMREAAALALGRRKDPRAFEPLLRMAAACDGARHDRAFEVLLDYGETAREPLVGLRKDANWRVALLAEVLENRIAGKDARVPDLEAEVAFSGNRRRVVRAALELAGIGEERSIEVIVRSCTDYWLDERTLLAEALIRFGPKGLEAAKRIPAPDPEKPEYRRRGRRHLGAAEALAKEKSPETLEKLLDGLRTARKPEKHGEFDLRVAYLVLLKEYRDPRILEAVLDFHGREPRKGWREKVEILGHYHDARATEVILYILERSDEFTRSLAAKELQRNSRGRTTEILLARLDEPATVRRQVSRLLALGWLGTPTDPVVERLIGLLEGHPTIAEAAAEALGEMTWRRYGGGIVDRRAVEPLCRWVTTKDGPNRGLSERYFLEPRDEEACRTLLRFHVAALGKSAWAARVLGLAGFPEVIPDLVRHRDVEALAELGPPGLEEVRKISTASEDAATKARALRLIFVKNHAIPFDEVASLLDRLIANGAFDPMFANPDEWTRGRMETLVDVAAQLAVRLDPEKAKALLAAGALRSPDPSVRRIAAAWAEGRAPEVPAELPEEEKSEEPPELLRQFELYRRTKDLDRLAAEGSIRALFEICYPLNPTPTREEFAQGDLALRALGFYTSAWLDVTIPHAAAIREWRRHGPWFSVKKKSLLRRAATLARERFDIERMRRFTKTNLDRLAQVANSGDGYAERSLLGYLLCTLRYSEDRSDRELLVSFFRRAEPVAAGVAIHVMRSGIVFGHERWGELPEHDYHAVYLEALEPSRPRVFHQAMHKAGLGDAARALKSKALASPDTDPDLRDYIAGHLWMELGDPAAADRLIGRLRSPDHKVFKSALHYLTRRRTAGAEVAERIVDAVKDRDPEDRVLTILHLMNFSYPKHSREAALAATAPFLESPIEEEREAARALRDAE